MTSQTPRSNRPGKSGALAIGLCAATTILFASLAGCSDEPEQAVQAAPAAKKEYVPPPPAPPSVESIASLMARLGIDDRVDLPEEFAPTTTEGRIAVLKFFDAFATGDHGMVEDMVTSADAAQLRALVDSGQWEDATDDVQIISIRTGRTRLGQDAALAIIETTDTVQPQLWSYSVNGTGAEFEANYTPDGIMDKIADPTMIGMWYDMIDEELALADKPDEEFIIPQQDYDDGDDSDSPSSQPSQTAPSGPTGPAIPRHKPSRKRSPKRPGTSPGG